MQKPNKKVQAGGLAGALTTLIIGVAGMAGVEVPAEVAAAATTLVFGLVAYFVPEPQTSK
tara:strand:+ start:2023 stop:2202 length:180 start_codon:yes stop_codon:yes gene_type:complete